MLQRLFDSTLLTHGSPTQGQTTQGQTTKGQTTLGQTTKGQKRDKGYNDIGSKMQQGGNFFYIFTSVRVSIYLLLLRVRLG